MIQTYQIGQLIELTDTVTVDGVATDPDGPYTFTLRDPTNATTTYTYGTDGEFVRDGVGAYHVNWLAALPGDHYYGFLAGDGAAQGAEESMFRVQKSHVR